MKIVFLSFYSGIVDRGVEIFVDSLANHLSKKHQVTVYQSGKLTNSSYYQTKTVNVVTPKQWKDDKLPPRHLLKRLFLNDRKRFELLFTLKCLKQLINDKPDIIIPLNSGWQAFICRIVSFCIKSKIIVAGQSGPGWDDLWLLLLKPDCFIALSKIQAEWANKAKIWKNTRIEIISNGVDLKKFSPNIKPIITSLQRPIILTVAAPIPSKRIDATINAVYKLKKASLLLVGSGYQNSHIDTLAKHTLGKNRYLHINVKHSHMPKMYVTADVFTLCSDQTEAFGIAYLEALASNLPCVATDDGLRREIIGPAGIYVKNPNNKNEYSKILAKALKIKWDNKPINQAKKYSWKIITQKYINLFNLIINNN